MRAKIETGLIRAHAIAALVSVVYVAIAGLIVAIKFHAPDWLDSIPWLTWGRLRYAHTQGVFFGWLGNAFLMFLYDAVPRLAGRPVTGRKLGWVLFFVWNGLLVAPGTALVQLGQSQPLEWAEYPPIVDAAAIAGLALACVQFVAPILRGRIADLYVSGWYILGGLTFTLLAYPVGNVAPSFFPGARGATYSGLWIHDAVGLFVTPLAVAVAYVVIPITTGKPIYSHFLSMIGFWLLFLVYPLNGTHHYIFSSIPMEAQIAAIAASVYLGVDVILVVTNQLLSLRGSSAIAASETPLRFTWVGIIAYLIVSLEGSLQALMPLNRFIHFSDWVIAHSHLAMIGFASFSAIGGMLFVWKRLPGARYNPRLADWSFWLLTIGLAIMSIDLTIAGLVQAKVWSSDAPWMESVRGSQSYWMVRSVSGILLLLGFASLFATFFSGPRNAPATEPIEPESSRNDVVEDLPRGLHWLQNAYVLTGVAGIGFFVFSFVLLAVWPNETLEQTIRASAPNERLGLSAAELRGRAIYGREGCVNCHSQLVRTTEDDARRFGPATQAWETDREFPQLWGTRRVGPDLAREHAKRTRDWQLVHLWNPRFVVPDSTMPAYPWLFDGGAGRPRREAIDLFAYLDSLGRDAEIAGRTGPKPLPEGDPTAEKRMGKFCDCAVPRTRGTAPIFSMEGLAVGERERLERRGAEVFARECVGCHGPNGRGDGPASPYLSPNPRDLSAARFADAYLSARLWNGSSGTAMPAWNDLSSLDFRAAIAFVRSLERPEAKRPEAGSTDGFAPARDLFRKQCAVCHGTEGEGDGLESASLYPRPTNFRLVRPDAARTARTIAEGVPGAAMPAWKTKLTRAEIDSLSRYVRSLYHP